MSKYLLSIALFNIFHIIGCFFSFFSPALDMNHDFFLVAGAFPLSNLIENFNILKIDVIRVPIISDVIIVSVVVWNVFRLRCSANGMPAIISRRKIVSLEMENISYIALRMPS